MKKSSNPGFKTQASDPERERPASAQKLARQDLEATWDIVIRAHYLAHEMRYYCTRYGQASAVVANVVADSLEKWATRFGAELEALESAPKGPADAPGRAQRDAS